MLPPLLVRRLVLAPDGDRPGPRDHRASPLLFVLALLFGLAGLLRAGRMRNLRLVSFVVVWLTAEIVALFMLFGLWIVSGFGGRLHTEPYQSRHYAVVRWFLDALYRGAERTYGLRIEIDEPELTGAELAGAAGQAGHRAVQARRAGRLVPARPAAAERLRPPAAGGDEGVTAVRSHPGRAGQPAAQRVRAAPGRAGRESSPSRSSGWPAAWAPTARW